MLFTGAEKSQGKEQESQAQLNILLGSTHCFISEQLAQRCPKTGRVYTITMADGSVRRSVSEHDFSAELQSCLITAKAVAMPMPPGDDVILGCNWMQRNQAVLLLQQGQCNL